MLDQRNDFDFYSIKINKMLMFLILLSYSRANTLAHVILDLVRVLLQTGPALNQMPPIWPHDGVIYSWLFKYTQQHTARFKGNSIWPLTSYDRPCVHPVINYNDQIRKTMSLNIYKTFVLKWNSWSGTICFNVNFVDICTLIYIKIKRLKLWIIFHNNLIKL